MGQMPPPKYFLPSSPYGSSPAINALNPTQPAAQNPQVPLLPPNFQDPGTMAQSMNPANMNGLPPGAGGAGGNPFMGRGGQNQMFGRGLFG